MSLVIDVHTHMLANEWLALLKQHGGPKYTVAPMGPLDRVIRSDGAPFMIPVPEMFDYDLRIKERRENEGNEGDGLGERRGERRGRPEATPSPILKTRLLTFCR